ncbi:MAG: TatA/E family twin arginine-targeting protein translocase [Pseudanabaena sp. CAN_BIN31]|nr:TatA/E family twin arginine-targeting protein translocase [Pseudanabaena sp. CAN_BIN31]
MNIFGIGLPEMILIMLVALLIFGPKKLPEIGRSMGKAIKGFQDASREFESEFKREADRLEQTQVTSTKTSEEVEAPAVAAPIAEVPSEIKEVVTTADV